MMNCSLSIATRCPLNSRNSVGADAAGSGETRGLESGEELRGARNAGVGCGVSGMTDAGRIACGGAGGIDVAWGRDFDAGISCGPLAGACGKFCDEMPA